MIKHPMWFDEIDSFFPREPSVLEGMFETLANSRSWIRPVDLKQAELVHKRLKQQREMENCQHGTRPYPINWRAGTHPFGPREFWINIPNTAGGPYLLSEADHQIFHDGRFAHEHIKEKFV